MRRQRKVSNGMVKMSNRFPSEPSNEAAKVFVESLRRNIPEAISNLRTDLDCYTTEDGWCFPYTVNQGEYDNAWVCSPYTALVAYSVEESVKIDSIILRKMISTLLPALGRYLRYIDFNRIVHCNNWLLSTNLYPEEVSRSSLLEIKKHFLQDHPNSAIVFRSLNTHLNSSLINHLKNDKYIFLPSRQVYMFDKSNMDYMRKRDIRRDVQLLNTSDLSYEPAVNFDSKDFVRAADLYQQLYVKKYSKNNPCYTDSFMKAIANNNNFDVKGFRNKSGVLDVVAANFTIGNITSAPIIGYDIASPQTDGLYRLGSLSTLLFANDNRYIYNASSGVPGFKMLRGAKPLIEYSAVYIDHLPAGTRWAWKGISQLLNRFYVPILKKYQL